MSWCVQIVHGDLKSLNILLTRHWAVAKLGDVGVARYLKSKDVPDHVACVFPLLPVPSSAMQASLAPVTLRLLVFSDHLDALLTVRCAGCVVGTFVYSAPEMLIGNDSGVKVHASILHAVHRARRAIVCGN